MRFLDKLELFLDNNEYVNEEVVNDRDEIKQVFSDMFDTMYVVNNSGMVEYYLSDPKEGENFSGSLEISKNRDGSYNISDADLEDLNIEELRDAVVDIMKSYK